MSHMSLHALVNKSTSPPSDLMSFVLSTVAKPVPSNSAVYATARPYGVPMGNADTMVSKGDSALEGGNRALVAATPAVRFW